MKAKLPLVYSCSGASSAAQMANFLAVRLDRLKVAEMSCIAGVGGDVERLVRTAKSGRPIVAMDGCPLHCAARILARHGLRVDRHYDLSHWHVKKRQHEDFEPAEAAQVLEEILADPEFPGRTPPPLQTSVAGAARLPPSPLPAADSDHERREYASPPCSLAEFHHLD